MRAKTIPQLLLLLLLSLAANAQNAEQPKSTDTEAAALSAVETFVNREAAAGDFSGVVVVAREGRPVFSKAYGMADKERNMPNRLDTRFNLGSINKIFTQIAIGQLVEQGKLSFDDHLGKILPDYPNREAAEKVTVRQLLSMSSGIGDIFGPKFAATPKERLRKIADFMPLFAAEPLLFEPGTNRRYSNGGYIVLGAIIEKLSGEDYYDYVRKHIYEAAGMTHTDAYERDHLPDNTAIGYTRRNADEQRSNNHETLSARGSSAGGGYSTADDLLKFVEAIRAGKLRLPNFRQETTARPGFGIAGGAPGVNAVLETGLADVYTIVVLSNYDPPSAEKVSKEVAQLLRGVKK